MKSILFLVCSNGFGHYKRSARVASKLLELDNDISVNFISKETTHRNHTDWAISKKLVLNERFTYIKGESTIEIDDINKSKQTINYNGIGWLNSRLIEEADLVISDNIGAILELRSDAILMGSFLWSDLIFKNEHRDLYDYANFELKLLGDFIPDMIALGDMAMPYVLRHTQTYLTSWIVDFNYKLNVRSMIKNILVLGGGTGFLDSELANVCLMLSKSRKYKVHTTNRISLLLSNKKSHVVFGFSNQDFKEIDLIIGRPGIGTLTDCVTHAIPILAIGETDNVEIQHNLRKIELLSFGLDISSNLTDINSIIDGLISDRTFQKFQEKLIHTKKTGLSETANFILKKLYER